MTLLLRTISTILAASLFLGCGGDSTTNSSASHSLPTTSPAAVPASLDDPTLAAASLKVLYFGNSHTAAHDIPKLVGDMIRFRQPQTTYASQLFYVGFLENAPQAAAAETINRHPWSFVVLQAQKISMSGKYKYSQKEGIDLAKAAKAKGATVLFFSEWGRRDVPDDGVVQESIYQEMADAAGVRVAPVGRAWDVALVSKPSLPLYELDGNHESEVGAFLTACVFYALFTDSDPAALADFEYADIPKADRTIMAKAASKVWNDDRAKRNKKGERGT